MFSTDEFRLKSTLKHEPVTALVMDRIIPIETESVRETYQGTGAVRITHAEGELISDIVRTTHKEMLEEGVEASLVEQSHSYHASEVMPCCPESQERLIESIQWLQTAVGASTHVAKLKQD